MFPQGDAHVLSSEPGARARPDMSVFVRRSSALPIVYERGGGGPTIHLKGAGHSTSGGWLATLFSIAVGESGSARAGRDNILARMSELMFVEVIRRYLEGLPSSQTGWLAGLRDHVVGQALAALHGEPATAWTVESLARSVGVSRSVLADRFATMVGQPPMQYLAMWRMQLASRRLLEGDSVAEAGTAVGYESEAAFSRAFKKLVGENPSAWRRTNGTRPSS